MAIKWSSLPPAILTHRPTPVDPVLQTPADLKQRLGVFYKNLPAREYKFLISEPDFTFNTLKKLLVNNELRDFDPVLVNRDALLARRIQTHTHTNAVQIKQEAFKVYDPQDTGYVDLETLRSIFSNLGFGEVTAEDVAVLIETADTDGDGKIGLADFRKMVAHSKAIEKDLDNLTCTGNAIKK